jgi:hypothetical protein
MIKDYSQVMINDEYKDYQLNLITVDATRRFQKSEQKTKCLQKCKSDD